MRGRDHQVLHDILGARPHPDASFAAARLAPVGIHSRALQVAAVRDGDRDVLHLDQIFEMNLAGVFDDLGAALVAELFLDVLQLLHDDSAQLFVGPEDVQIFGDLNLDSGQLFDNLLDLHAGQALQLQFDDGLRLPFGEPLICYRVRGIKAIKRSRASRGVFESRISLITASRFSSAFLKPSKICSRSRALRSR